MVVPRKSLCGKTLFAATYTALLALVPTQTFAAWEPEAQVELVVPASADGSLDQTARLIQDIVVKHKLMKQDLVVVNRRGGAGAEGFLEIKNAKGNPHKLLFAGNTLFTTPMSTGVPVSWKDTTPVAMMGLESMMLWTRSSQYASARQYIDAAKAAGPNKMKMGGVGSRQEDNMLEIMIERATNAQFVYVPHRWGDDVAVALAEGNVDSSLNRAAIAGWRAGTLTPQCVFNDARLPYKAKVTATSSWSDIPTCREAGIPAAYESLRGIFMTAGVTSDQLAYYVDLTEKIRATPEWKAYMQQWAFDQKFMTGKAFDDWLAKSEQTHKRLMEPECFLAKC
ncbi:MAG TPA: tripartite tricarboxylate transporter substrate-binding protein [Burkholderiales bacterium]|nr:tripartite tricarboxylate transporter substrate-binding protein [Burkholderiales bacterium]